LISKIFRNLPLKLANLHQRNFEICEKSINKKTKKNYDARILPNDNSGPYGAKGLAKRALNPVAPAIADAIFHSTGAGLTTLP
jgi:CO/xanthine dehydrogenase Mo-binding subunit